MTDNSSILPNCAPIAHFLEFFCIFGSPANAQTNPPVSIVVNHGYALGYSPDRGQPLWAAYQVAAAVRDVDFQRPEFFYDDPRLAEGWRTGLTFFPRLSPADKAKLVNQTSPTVWPFASITPEINDHPAPEG